LAGGFGTRLPLKNLSEGGVDTVVLAVNYMAEALVRYFGPTKFDLGIIYSREERPLGHGGPIKKAEDILRGDEPFLVLNGDIVSDIDYKRLVDFHKEKGGLATVALYQVHDPSRYGAVEIDGDGRIHRFVEKPEPGEAPSNLVNAGIYVFEPEVIDFIPPGRPVSTEREVFPILAEKGALYGFEIRGLWMDIGVPVDYLRANGKILEKMNGVIMGEGCEIDGAAEIRRPCCIGSGVVVGANSVIGPSTSISDHVHIGQGCRIENSIIFPGVTIGDYTSIRNALIGENATLERWVKVESGSIIGDYAVIADEVTITEDVSICPSKRVEESILEPRQVM